MKKKYTSKQGQYLAFIYYYTKINGQAPAEADMQRYFKVSPPSVHQMVLTLEKKFNQKNTQGGTFHTAFDFCRRIASFGIKKMKENLPQFTIPGTQYLIKGRIISNHTWHE